MQNTSEQFKLAISQPDREMVSRITFPDFILNDEQIQRIEWDSTIVGQTDFEIGTAPMDMVNINLIHEVDDPIMYDFDGQECEIEIGIILPDDTIEYVSIGKFTVDRVEKTNNIISIHAVDRMYKFETPYESELEYPATVLEIAQDICTLVGVELATTTFPNSDYEVSILPEFTDMSCRTAIAQIAELAGGYARIDRSGKLEIFNIQTTAYNSEKYAGNHYILGDLFIADELIVSDIEITGENYIDFSNKRMPTAKIEKVIIKTGDEEASKGVGENTYYIVNNVFCQNPHAAVDTLYEVLSGLSYTPFNMKWQGNPAVDCGDMITVRSVHGGYYNTLITRRKLTYTGGLREDYEAVGKSNIEKESTPKSSISLDVDNLKTEFRVLSGEVSAKVSKDDIISEINQTAEEIKILAEKISLEGLITANGNFKVLPDGTVEAVDGSFSGTITSENGEIGGFNITENGLTKSFQKTWGPFTQADLTRVQDIILGNITPSQSDYDKYDINGSGHLSGLDMLAMQKMISGYTPYTVEYTITLNTQDMREMIVLSSSLGDSAKIGAFGINAPIGRFNDVVIKSGSAAGGYRLSVDQDGFVRAEPETG